MEISSWKWKGRHRERTNRVGSLRVWWRIMRAPERLDCMLLFAPVVTRKLWLIALRRMILYFRLPTMCPPWWHASRARDVINSNMGRVGPARKSAAIRFSLLGKICSRDSSCSPDSHLVHLQHYCAPLSNRILYDLNNQPSVSPLLCCNFAEFYDALIISSYVSWRMPEELSFVFVFLHDPLNSLSAVCWFFSPSGESCGVSR
jgi:hypothetical protein